MTTLAFCEGHRVEPKPPWWDECSQQEALVWLVQSK